MMDREKELQAEIKDLKKEKEWLWTKSKKKYHF